MSKGENTYVSKENNLGPGDKIGISGVLKVRFLFCKGQLFRTIYNFLYPYQMLSFHEIRSFTRALRNTDHEVSAPKCPGKWLYFINQGQLFQINYINCNIFVLYVICLYAHGPSWPI